MNQYRSYFDRVKVSNTLHQKLLSGKRAEKRRAGAPARYGSMVACFALICLAGFGVWRWSAPPVGGDITAADSIIPGEKDTYGPGETPGVLATPTPVATEEPLTLSLAFTDRTNDPEPAMSIALPQGRFTEHLDANACRELLGVATLLSWAAEPYEISGQVMYDGEGQIWQAVIQGVSEKDADKTFTITLAPGRLPPECVVYEGGETNEVDGVSVQADYFVFDRDGDSRDEYVSRTAFLAGDVGVRIEVIDHTDTQALAETTTLAILRGKGVKLNELVPAEIPEWRSENLTLAQARAEETFGQYVPDFIPSGFAFVSAYRELGQNRDWLSIYWAGYYTNISVTISRPFEAVEVMEVENKNYYDERLYTIPHCDSVPDEVMFGGFQDPVFRFEDLTLDVFEARLTYIGNDAGDVSGYRGNFSVLYPSGMVARYSLKGVTPEEAAELLDIIK